MKANKGKQGPKKRSLDTFVDEIMERGGPKMADVYVSPSLALHNRC
jgi:hypothetical protein